MAARTVGIAVLATALMALMLAHAGPGDRSPALEHGGATREQDTVAVSTATVLRASGLTIVVTVDPTLTGGITKAGTLSSYRGDWYIASGRKDRVAGEPYAALPATRAEGH